MKKLINLEDLLKHEILDLYSAEEQIIEALPAMIEKASDTSLKEALTQHLEVTRTQKERLDNIKAVILEDDESENEGFFTKLFGGGDTVTSKGIKTLIEEAESLMAEDMEPDTRDAAIIGAAQKIEHYEIAGYGTARAYAEQLGMEYVAEELVKTLNEEYSADEALTLLATEQINLLSEVAGDTEDNNDNKSEFDDFESDDDSDDDSTIGHDQAIPGVDHRSTSPIASVERDKSSL